MPYSVSVPMTRKTLIAVSLMPCGEHYAARWAQARCRPPEKRGTPSPPSPPWPAPGGNRPAPGGPFFGWAGATCPAQPSQVLAGVGDRVDGPARLGALLA